MPDISVVVVSFNGKEFLKNCLHSIYQSGKHLSVEIIVVDNHSMDGSAIMVEKEFPEVVLIPNDKNQGYAKACNQGIRKAKGSYILILNPDTLLEENCLTLCLQFVQTHPNAGAVGVKMYDGAGNYLPESKRGFPWPWTSLWKISGLYKFFPHSARFNYYYLGHLDKEETHKIDVLTGAFMFIPRRTFEMVGLFDEAFFMYGEDIDLSYRIQQSGLDVYYFPDTSIVHFKGISTRKSSYRYVILFYRAMLQFSRKHFTDRKYRATRLIIKMAIYFRAFMAIFKRLADRVLLPILDFLVFLSGMYGIKNLWAYYYFGDPSYYEQSSVNYNLLLYATIWLGAIHFHFSTNKRLDSFQLLRSSTFGLILILIVYALLPMDWRSSRALIFLSYLWVIMSGLVLRHALKYLRGIRDVDDRQLGKQTPILLIGEATEIDRIRNEIQKTKSSLSIYSVIQWNSGSAENFDKEIELLPESFSNFPVDHILVCLNKFPSSQLFRILKSVGQRIPVRIIGEESLQIVGSHSKKGPGYLYSLEVQYAIDTPYNRILKRLLDLFLVPIIFILSPIIAWKRQKSILYVWNELGLVIRSKKTWVGYDKRDPKLELLPDLPGGIFTCLPLENNDLENSSENWAHHWNVEYALKYSVWKDLAIFLKKIIN